MSSAALNQQSNITLRSEKAIVKSRAKQNINEGEGFNKILTGKQLASLENCSSKGSFLEQPINNDAKDEEWDDADINLFENHINILSLEEPGIMLHPIQVIQESAIDNEIEGTLSEQGECAEEQLSEQEVEDEFLSPLRDEEQKEEESGATNSGMLNKQQINKSSDTAILNQKITSIKDAGEITVENDHKTYSSEKNILENIVAPSVDLENNYVINEKPVAPEIFLSQPQNNNLLSGPEDENIDLDVSELLTNANAAAIYEEDYNIVQEQSVKTNVGFEQLNNNLNSSILKHGRKSDDNFQEEQAIFSQLSTINAEDNETTSYIEPSEEKASTGFGSNLKDSGEKLTDKLSDNLESYLNENLNDQGSGFKQTNFGTESFSQNSKSELLKPGQQVFIAVKEALSEPGAIVKKEITINLFPESLGHVKVEISSILSDNQEKKIQNIKFITNNKETLEILEQSKADLEKNLKSVSDIKEDASLQFEMNQQNNKNNNNYFESSEERDNWMNNFVSRDLSEESEKSEINSPDPIYANDSEEIYYLTEDNINIRV
jgi:hypothetical protein